MLDCAALPETAAEGLAEVVADNGPPVPAEAEEGLVRLIFLGLWFIFLSLLYSVSATVCSPCIRVC